MKEKGERESEKEKERESLLVCINGFPQTFTLVVFINAVERVLE